MRKLRILRLSREVVGSAAGVRSNAFTVRDAWSGVYGARSAMPRDVTALGPVSYAALVTGPPRRLTQVAASLRPAADYLDPVPLNYLVRNG